MNKFPGTAQYPIASANRAEESDFVEAATGCKATADPEGFNRAMLLDWSHARAVGLDAAADLDLAPSRLA